VEEARRDAGVSTKRLSLQNRFYDRIRSRAAKRAAKGPTVSGGFDALRGQKYCLIVTFKRDGTGIPTPVWFGLDDDGRLFFRTGANVAKVRRIRSQPRVLVAPCTVRGKPLGPSIEGSALVVGPERKEHAEAAIQSNYGLGRRLYESAADAVGGDEVYVEVAPRTGGEDQRDE
jgi:PPOX class probable F420-dependent enzyme